MSHFLGARLKTLHHGRLDKRHAVVSVRVAARNELRMVKGTAIGICRDDTEFVELPEDVEVTDPDGEPIPRDAPRVRVVTTATFDPFHCIADVAPELLWAELLWATRRRRT
jgi:hypothetical protein